MAVKKIVVTNNSKVPPQDMGPLTFDKDSNGRLKIRGVLPKGMTQAVADSICSDLYIGMKNGNVDHFSWTE